MVRNFELFNTLTWYDSSQLSWQRLKSEISVSYLGVFLVKGVLKSTRRPEIQENIYIYLFIYIYLCLEFIAWVKEIGFEANILELYLFQLRVCLINVLTRLCSIHFISSLSALFISLHSVRKLRILYLNAVLLSCFHSSNSQLRSLAVCHNIEPGALPCQRLVSALSSKVTGTRWAVVLINQADC
jgi:hypothetical protein